VTDTATTESKPVIKQFGPAKDEAGNLLPAPKPAGVDMTELAKHLYEASKSFVGADNFEAFIAAADSLEKPSVPGHKAGRCAYNLSNYVLGIVDLVEAATRVRKGGGAGEKLKKQADTIEKLKAKLAALGVDIADLLG
jgi:hypothetical protein